MYLIRNRTKLRKALKVNIKFHALWHYTKKMQFLDLRDFSWQWKAEWKNG